MPRLARVLLAFLLVAAPGTPAAATEVFDLPERMDPYVPEARGEVVWCEDMDCGIAFLQPLETDTESLEAYRSHQVRLAGEARG